MPARYGPRPISQTPRAQHVQIKITLPSPPPLPPQTLPPATAFNSENGTAVFRPNPKHRVIVSLHRIPTSARRGLWIPFAKYCLIVSFPSPHCSEYDPPPPATAFTSAAADTSVCSTTAPSQASASPASGMLRTWGSPRWRLQNLVQPAHRAVWRSWEFQTRRANLQTMKDR